MTKMAATPLVSVVMAAYNAEKTIGSAIESVLIQSLRDFEFILINDGSTDATGDVIHEFATRDHRIRVITQENMGLTKALNVGLTLVRAPFIARQDADDVSLEGRLQAQVDTMLADPALVLVGTDVLIEDDDGKSIGVLRNSRRRNIERALARKNQFVHGSLMFRRIVNGEAVTYRPYYKKAQDYDLCLRLAELGQVAILPHVGYKLVIPRSSVTSSLYTFFGEQARRNALLRRSGLDERFPVVPLAETTIKATEAGYCLRCARFALTCGNVNAGRSLAERALRLGGLQGKYLREAWRLYLQSFIPARLGSIVRERML